MSNSLTVKEFEGGKKPKKQKLGVSFDGQDAPPAEQKGEITLIQFKVTGLSNASYTRISLQLISLYPCAPVHFFLARE